ncbi:hypothetical protein [Paractinoplanes atraurantiacus]|uniref:Uncharacterized protein n=1 Tax=Paractinoplanes atraurantiacus TaxID=1036182 RepID=A0A285IHK9_9ACTN|nr:hypothetical protein [Actinoplanes atraurantiacus]SNY47465.1 hypothetical protein SAMN05421748_108143 [Actinoplanes atraurantiacus]
MPEPEIKIGTMNVHGGQQNIGGQNTNVQNNYYAAPAEEVRSQLDVIREQHPLDVQAIESDLQEGTPEARTRIQTRLRALAESATSTRTVVEAAAAIGAIVASQWPF